MNISSTEDQKENYKIDYIKLVEKKFLENSFINKASKDNFYINIGDIIRIGYLIPEGEKERTQYYEGLIIAKQNKGLGKSFTLRRSIQGIGVEQVFLINSPKILSIIKKQASKVRRAKLYFIRTLKGKTIKLKKIT